MVCTLSFVPQFETAMEQSVDIVIDRVRAAAKAHGNGVIAFDADGTLWSGDVGDDLLAALLADDVFSEATREGLSDEAHRHAIPIGTTPSDTMRELLRAHSTGLYPEERLLEIVGWGLAGHSDDEVHGFSKKVLANTPRQLNAETVMVLEAMRGAIEVFVVSASPRAIVEEAVAPLSIDVRHVIAATAIYNNGHMIADVERPIPYGPGKMAQLKRVIGKRPLLAAFGDNHFDAQMLAAAAVPVAVRPKPALQQLLATIPGVVQLSVAAA
jgi:phosphatidylglycerophosphatase C